MFSLPSSSSLLKVPLMPRCHLQNRNSLPLVKLFSELFFLLQHELKITSISCILFVAKLIQERERKFAFYACATASALVQAVFTLNGICVSPHVRESRTVLDSGSRIPSTGFQPLSVDFWSLESNRQWDSGFHKQKFARFRKPDSLTWGDVCLPSCLRLRLASLNECIVFLVHSAQCILLFSYPLLQK